MQQCITWGWIFEVGLCLFGFKRLTIDSLLWKGCYLLHKIRNFFLVLIKILAEKWHLFLSDLWIAKVCNPILIVVWTWIRLRWLSILHFKSNHISFWTFFFHATRVKLRLGIVIYLRNWLLQLLSGLILRNFASLLLWRDFLFLLHLNHLVWMLRTHNSIYCCLNNSWSRLLAIILNRLLVVRLALRSCVVDVWKT